METYCIGELSGDVLIVGGYGVGNIGDEAILTGILKDSSQTIENITIVSHNKQETEQMHTNEVPAGVKISAIEPSPIQLATELYKNDHFIFGGGGLFSHYMGPYAEKIPYYAMAAKLLGRSVHWCAIGVYPSTPKVTKQSLKLIMNRSDTVSVRDPISKQTLTDIGVDGITLVEDPATQLDADPLQGRRLLQKQDIDPDNQIFAIAARRVKNRNNNENLQYTYAEVAKEMNQGCEVVFIPFCKHSYETLGMDGEVCESLAKKIDGGKVISYSHPIEALSIVAAVDGLLATRLHSMIFAHIAETDLVAIEYADKVTSLLAQYKKEHRGISLEGINPQSTIQKINQEIGI